MRGVCFAEREMVGFADASGDVNPIHVAEPVAGAGPFEAPVVYGALSVLASLGSVKPRPGRTLRLIDAIFSHPLLAGNTYQLVTTEQSELEVTAVIVDSDIQLCGIKASYGEGASPCAQVAEGHSRLHEPLMLDRSIMAARRLVTGEYGGRTDSTRWLERRFDVAKRGVSVYALQGLLCVSYIIGMRLPGIGGMLSRLQLTLPEVDASHDSPQCGQPLSYSALVIDFDSDLQDLTVSGAIHHGEQRVAMFTCEARLSGVPFRGDSRKVKRRLGVSDGLANCVAVVVGASRGLGAALTQSMASQGCYVYACSRTGSGPESDPMWSGTVEHVRGECGDPRFCQRLLARILERHGGVHFLLCCAAPRVGAIGFGAQSIERFNQFIRQSVELVTVPTATFMGSLDEQEGSYLLISSSALDSMPREWGHYVAAKAASEALAVWAGKRFANVELVVARVPRLGRGWDGGVTTGRDDMQAPEDVAARLVRRLAKREAAGVHIVEW